MPTSKIQWVIVYHNDDDNEYDYEQDGIPNHRDRSIKFIRRGDKYYVAKQDGWMRVDEERAERQRPYVPRAHMQQAVSSGRFPR